MLDIAVVGVVGEAPTPSQTQTGIRCMWFDTPVVGVGVGKDGAKASIGGLCIRTAAAVGGEANTAAALGMWSTDEAMDWGDTPTTTKAYGWCTPDAGTARVKRSLASLGVCHTTNANAVSCGWSCCGAKTTSGAATS